MLGVRLQGWLRGRPTVGVDQGLGVLRVELRKAQLDGPDPSRGVPTSLGTAETIFLRLCRSVGLQLLRGLLQRLNISLPLQALLDELRLRLLSLDLAVRAFLQLLHFFDGMGLGSQWETSRWGATGL